MTTQANTESRQLRRAEEGGLVGGVAAGIAGYFGIEVLVLRVAFIAATLIGGVGAVLYVLALLLIPREGDEKAIVSAPRRAGVGAAIALILLAIGGGVLISGVDLLGAGNVGAAAYLVALGLAALWWRDNMAEPSTPTAPLTARHDNPYPRTELRLEVAAAPDARGRSWTLPTLSLALVVAGVLALLNATDVISIGIGGIFAAALGVVGLGLAFSAFNGRGGGLIPIGIVLALFVATLASAGTSFSGGFGERVWAPAAVSEIPDKYEFGAGDAVLDLADLTLPPGTTSVQVEIGAGNLEVEVPDDINLEVDARVGGGNINLNVAGQSVNDAGFGSEIDRQLNVPGATSRLELDIDMGFGNINVRD